MIDFVYVHSMLKMGGIWGVILYLSPIPGLFSMIILPMLSSRRARKIYNKKISAKYACIRIAKSVSLWVTVLSKSWTPNNRRQRVWCRSGRWKGTMWSLSHGFLHTRKTITRCLGLLLRVIKTDWWHVGISIWYWRVHPIWRWRHQVSSSNQAPKKQNKVSVIKKSYVYSTILHLIS